MGISALQGQAFVEDLCERTLRTVRVNTEHGTEYLIDLSNQANVEASTMREYRGRYVFELLQNANDAIREVRDKSGTYARKTYRVRIQLTEDSLIIANDGMPFLEKDVESIYRWGESSKDPNKSVGYKGIGFKSVLEITESPQIFSPIVQFHFDRNTCYASIQKIVGKKRGLKLPITRFVFPFPIDSVELPDRELVSDLLNGLGFSTVIRLPLLKEISREQVLERIEQDLDPALLLFLNGIDEIEVWESGKRQRAIARKVSAPRRKGQGKDITLLENKVVVSRWLLFDSPKLPINPEANLKQIRDNAWSRVKKVGFAIAFPLDEQGHLKPDTEISNLFVYFPTGVSSGLRYRIHADFFIDAARKTIQTLQYNLWLGSQIAGFLRNIVLPELIVRFPENREIIRLLVPELRDDFAGELHSILRKALTTCAFVKNSQGTYSSPLKLLFAPIGLQGKLAEFHRYFPEYELTHYHRGRQFPDSLLYDYPECVLFLTELGAHPLAVEDVVKLLDQHPSVGEPKEYQGFYEFLWYWYDNQQDNLARQEILDQLSRSAFIVTINNKWIRPQDRLYHAKLRFETPNMPGAIQANVVHPDSYGDQGTNSSTYKLLSIITPKVRDYDASEIIRTSILPLGNEGKFQKLSVAERVEIYRYLFDFWKNRRAGDYDVEKSINNLIVPTHRLTDRRSQAWKPASETYLSSYWSGDKRLEELFQGLDCAFLYGIPGLSITESERVEWYQFWLWVGIASAPRFLVQEYDHYSTLDWNRIVTSHPHSSSIDWKEYIQEARDNYYYCATHGIYHGFLTRSVTIDKLSQLIESNDSQKMLLLYEFLGKNWNSLDNIFKQATVTCKRSHAYVSHLESHWLYVLKKHAWIPAATSSENGKPNWRFYPPNQCWLISESEDPVVGSLLPSPPNEISYLLFRQFAQYIGIRSLEEAGLDELVDILIEIPNRYPDPNISVTAGKRPVKRALSALTRWVIGRINNLLVQSETKLPPITPISLVVQDGNSLRYSNPEESIFFADDRYHSPRWRDYLPFAPLDDDWREAAKYLGLKFVSEWVEEDVTPGEILVDETETLSRRYKTARPYLLALVADQRTSARDDSAKYLTHLEIQVVNELAVQRRITLDPSKTITDMNARVYLKEEMRTRLGSSGRAPRTGILYVHKDVADNYDLLGGPISSFIRIPGLADAFVLLLDRGGSDGRLRYLKMRGMDESVVEEMRILLRQSGSIDEEEILEIDLKSDQLNSSLLEGWQHKINLVEVISPEPAESHQELTDEGTITQPVLPGEQNIEFPELDTENIIVLFVENPATPENSKIIGGRIGGKRKNWKPVWEHDQKLRDAYGLRGEELVYRLEIQRLITLGIAGAENNVHWLRKSGELAADHDIESVDIIADEVVPITIEVKSTPGTEFRVFMSREELECAHRVGKNYRLYRVIDVATATPKIYVFENPYTLWEKGLAIIEVRDTSVLLPNPLDGTTPE